MAAECSSSWMEVILKPTVKRTIRGWTTLKAGLPVYAVQNKVSARQFYRVGMALEHNWDPDPNQLPYPSAFNVISRHKR